MLLKFALFAIAASALVAATPTPVESTSQCDTGDAQCCNNLESADSKSLAGLLGLLGVVVQDVVGQIGLGCTPISIIGLAQAANCAQQPVCCSNNQFNGLVNIGCTPVSL